MEENNKQTTSMCPFCDSTDITFLDINFYTDTTFTQECLCNNCGCEFTEKYKCKKISTDVTYSPSI